MKALTIKQPWASLIAHDIKDVENRTWKTKFRGRIYIHVSAAKFTGKAHQFTPEQLNACQAGYRRGILPDIDKLPYSAIIGEVDIVDCVMDHPSIWAEDALQIVAPKVMGGPFQHIITYNWVLANPVMYDEPILNVKGKLSFWEYKKEVIS